MSAAKHIWVWFAAAALCCGCEKRAGQHIFTDVTLHVHVPGEPEIIFMSIDMSLKGNYLRNLNTQQEFDCPVFVNGSASVRLLKGVYMIAFDAPATFADGSVRNIRFAGYNSPRMAVSLLNDAETLDLELTVL